MNWFGQFTLSLFISAVVDEQLRVGVYSGFAIHYKNNFYWITAGHVLEEIDGLLTNPNIKVERPINAKIISAHLTQTGNTLVGMTFISLAKPFSYFIGR